MSSCIVNDVAWSAAPSATPSSARLIVSLSPWGRDGAGDLLVNKRVLQKVLPEVSLIGEESETVPSGV